MNRAQRRALQRAKGNPDLAEQRIVSKASAKGGRNQHRKVGRVKEAQALNALDHLPDRIVVVDDAD